MKLVMKKHGVLEGKTKPPLWQKSLLNMFFPQNENQRIFWVKTRGGLFWIQFSPEEKQISAYKWHGIHKVYDTNIIFFVSVVVVVNE